MDRSIINQEIGKKIRLYRKKNNMTLDDLSAIVFKSKATLSKYEKGEISIDIETLYEIASALDIHITQLLFIQSSASALENKVYIPPFFRGLHEFHGYFYDGRNNTILRMLFKVLPPDDSNVQQLYMYMNYLDLDHYPICENTYTGTIEHYDAMTVIQLENRHLPMEKASVQILATSLDFEYKMGLWTGFSSRPMMPVATKMLISKKPLTNEAEFINLLKISKEDIRLLKMYNLFTAL